ncbi:VPLPA-CTERM sorting domain-containing protein [Porticoccaceae bacterium]|nr:VPLPA-CTERM sorting domain-containing protein [Porticoccaceae bacterium]
MKKVFLIVVVALYSLMALPASADTVDLLSIWKADKKNDLGGVDVDGDSSIDMGYGTCIVPNCEVNTGDLSKITSKEFWQGGVANDHPAPDMQNMLAFEGIVIGDLVKTLESNPASTKSLTSTVDFSGYITVKASGSVWLYFVEDLDGHGVDITIGNALDGKLHNISHYAEWGMSEVPLPAAAWFFITGLIGLAGIRKRGSTD